MPASPSPEPTLTDLLEALDRLAGTEFHEVDLRLGDARLRVARASATAAEPLPPGPAGVPAAPGPAAPVDPLEGLDVVNAPMVGTFYRRPRPEAEPFVSVGDQVRKGQVLCIIEAMKLMNNIEAETAGEVVEIVPEDGSPVQFGDRLFLVRPS